MAFSWKTHFLSIFLTVLGAFISGDLAYSRGQSIDQSINRYSNAQAEYYRKLKKLPFREHRTGTAQTLRKELESKSKDIKETSIKNTKKLKKDKNKKKKKSKKKKRSKKKKKSKRKKSKSKSAMSNPTPTPAPESSEPFIDPSTIPAELNFSGKVPKKKKKRKRGKPSFVTGEELRRQNKKRQPRKKNRELTFPKR